MTREELIEQAALNYGHNNPNGHWNADAEYEEDYETPSLNFQAGAEWAFDYDSKSMLHVLNKGVKQGYKDAFEKALEWWKEELTYPSMSAEEIAWIDAKIEDFKKFMEDQE